MRRLMGVGVTGVIGLYVLGLCLLSLGCSAPGKPSAQVTHTGGPSVEQAQMERYNGPRARVAVGDFQVKASDATWEIGDGLREMLLTGLFDSNHFIVLERQAIQDVILEQDLGASGRVKRQTAAPIGQLEGAEVLIYGVVSEFKMGSGGVGIGVGMPNLPLSVGGGAKNAHLAIDLRAVDTTTGRVVFATRVKGKATDYRGEVGTRIGGGSTEMPIALGAYKNTSMEKAIRVCIDSAVDYLCTKVPQQYFHHQQ